MATYSASCIVREAMGREVREGETEGSEERGCMGEIGPRRNRGYEGV